MLSYCIVKQNYGPNDISLSCGASGQWSSSARDERKRTSSLPFAYGWAGPRFETTKARRGSLPPNTLESIRSQFKCQLCHLQTVSLGKSQLLYDSMIICENGNKTKKNQ